MSKKGNSLMPIQSTAGAIPVRNDKGQVSMQKVKVNRYVSGKRPEYAPRSSSDEESDDEQFIVPNRLKQEPIDEDFDVKFSVDVSEAEKSDHRLRRLEMAQQSRRKVAEPKILDEEEMEVSEAESEEEERPGRRHVSDSESDDEDMDDDEIERRRAFIRQRALEKQEEEVLIKEEEKSSASEESESEYEEYTDSEEEARPRLKPVFVRKRERVTIKEKELEEKEIKEEEAARKKAEERRRETLRLVEEEIRKDKGEKTKVKLENEDEIEVTTNVPQLTDVITDDENEEAEYEAWKLRELKRIKRDRDERDTIIKEKMEIDRLHGMTEEERRLELKLKPKHISNKASKGKYKFLQKYYHRGVFYLDKDDDVYKRDYSAPTLEDHFDKTILPKVMQVKNFGRSGRTKYTHLVDQDTTSFDSAWVAETTQNLKFHATQAGGVRQTFERPSLKKKKS